MRDLRLKRSSESIDYSDAFEGDGTWAAGRTRRVGRDGPLLGLAGSSVADRFRAWAGLSGRRYIFSVFPLDRAMRSIERIPAEGGSIVIGVERLPDGTRRLIFVAESGSAPEAFFRSGAVEDLRSRAGAELHIHLTPGDDAARRAIVADLAG